MAAQRIYELYALSNEGLVSSERHRASLMLGALHGHIQNVRAQRSLSISLLPLDAWFEVNRRYQANLAGKVTNERQINDVFQAASIQAGAAGLYEDGHTVLSSLEVNANGGSRSCGSVVKEWRSKIETIAFKARVPLVPTSREWGLRATRSAPAQEQR